jgi:DNA-binding YbaB/EbfC family protein
MKGIPGSLQQLMRQANQMQSKIKKVKEELATREFEGRSGGGAVVIKVNGDNKILAVQINPDVFKSGDADILQDMVLAAANDALKVANDTSQAEIEKVTGGFSMGGMF